ncbi:MAG: hypothetical protein AAF738_03765 [Bacteroidota bacterium]
MQKSDTTSMQQRKATNSMSYGKYLLWIGLFGLFWTCQKEPSVTAVIPSFYHWQTDFNLADTELNYLKSLKVNRLYCKFFDVDWAAGEAFPTATIQWSASAEGFAIVPTVFITNRTLRAIFNSQLDTLALKIAQKIQRLAPPQGFQEVQFDCDWSETSRGTYFELLRLLKLHFPTKILSATIRLHQVKFFEQTGVPPIDRGLLMCYNVGKLEAWTSANSILDTTILKQYLYNFERYPLPLDIALPIFHWGLVFRKERLLRIMNNLSMADLRDARRFRAISKDSTRFELVRNTYLNGHYLYQGDRLRLESVSYSTLQAAARHLHAQLPPSQDLHIAFYHLDTATIQRYPYEQLEQLLYIFEQ